MPVFSPARAESLPVTTIRVGQHQISAEVPVLWVDRARGLSGRASLAPGKGMAFVYLKPHSISMHMQGMNFGLDFLFCRNDKIVQIERGVQPSDKPVELSSDQPVHLVLEIAEGQAGLLDLQLGDACMIEMPARVRQRLQEIQAQ